MTPLFEFVPNLLQGPAYNCSAVMPPGQAWADRYGIKQIPFGVASITIGMIAEILYIPCLIGLGKDLHSSCIKIMFWLALLDMLGILASCILFGVVLLEGAVYCSNQLLTLGAGIAGYGVWLATSSCSVLLAINRLFELLNLSAWFTKRITNVCIGACVGYGLLMITFTKPSIFNSTYQSSFFSPFIPGHNFAEYENFPLTVHNIVIAVGSLLLYLTLCIVLMVKSRGMSSASSSVKLNYNMPVLFQSMLIGCINFLAAAIFIYMNYVSAPQELIIIGQVCWQLTHGMWEGLAVAFVSPPFIYLSLNKTLRKGALNSVGLGRLLLDNNTKQVTSSTLPVTF